MIRCCFIRVQGEKQLIKVRKCSTANLNVIFLSTIRCYTDVDVENIEFKVCQYAYKVMAQRGRLIAPFKHFP